MTSADASQTVSISAVKGEADLFQALAIREVVFIEEQHVPEGIERDAADAQAHHVLAFQGGHAVGTGRLVVLVDAPAGEEGRWAQIGRMAVLRAHRKAKVGSLLLTALEQEALQRNVKGIVLHAQMEALQFYVKHGYVPEGTAFQEAGMAHIEMRKKF